MASGWSGRIAGSLTRAELAQWTPIPPMPGMSMQAIPSTSVSRPYLFCSATAMLWNLSVARRSWSSESCPCAPAVVAAAAAPPLASATTATADHIACLIFISGAFLHRVDLARNEAVGLTVNGRRGMRRRRLDEAEHLAARLIHPIPQVLDVVVVLGLQVGHVCLGDVACGHPIGNRVDIHEKRHAELLRFDRAPRLFRVARITVGARYRPEIGRRCPYWRCRCLFSGGSCGDAVGAGNLAARSHAELG